MEQKPPVEQEAQPKEKIFTKSTLVIMGIFVVLQLGFFVVVFWSRIFPSGGGKEVAVAEVMRGQFISLGRLEVSRPMDPLRENVLRINVNIELEVPSERFADLSSAVARIQPLLRELARKAFNDADPQDLIGERDAGVKNAIRNSFNQELGEDAVQNVVFSDYRTY